MKKTFRGIIAASALFACSVIPGGFAGATTIPNAPVLGGIAGKAMSSGAALMSLGALNSPGTPKTGVSFIDGGMQTVSGIKLVTSPNPEIKSYTATSGFGVTSDPNNNGFQIAQSNEISGVIIQAPVGQPGHPGQPGGGH
ncbi:MAG: hypothetical protein HGB18_05395 [Candidatus Moranbacteria bacterium]|nr:hypothetical protein [Candidatus Moranbacteria bacterium]